MDRKAQTYILKFGQEKAWGATVEWPLIAHIQGLSIDYKTAKGLVWEDPIKFSQEVKQYASFVQWQHAKFESIDEWEKRLNIAHVQTEVIRRLTLEGLDRQRLASL